MPLLIGQQAHAGRKDEFVLRLDLLPLLQHPFPLLRREIRRFPAFPQFAQAEVAHDGQDPSHRLAAGTVPGGGGIDADIAVVHHVLGVGGVF